MSTGVKSFIFVLLLPFFGALGHDVYFNYFSTDEKVRAIKNLRIDTEEFLISDLGWLWQNYFPQSMQIARDSTEPSIWVSHIDPILQMPSMVVGIMPFFVGCVYLLLAFVLGVWPFTKFGRERRETAADFAVYKHAKDKSMKFSKK